MTLTEYLKELGTERAAKLFKVDKATIGYWRRGDCLPRPKYLLAIHRCSSGLVTYESMIKTVARKASK